jgi:hypothetical protein
MAEGESSIPMTLRDAGVTLGMVAASSENARISCLKSAFVTL